MGGGRGRSRIQRKHFKQSRENVWERSKPNSEQQQRQQGDAENNGNPTWEPFTIRNDAFDNYYKEQGIVSPEEWDTFIEFLRKPLPAAFRINSSSQFYMDIRSQLENGFMKSLQAEGVDGSEVEPIRPLPWYPDNLAWQSDFSRNQLRKDQALQRFHIFLKEENEIGNITRQEAVSMVPPLFLDVHPDHYILDMCAAPGSKTFQLLEMIHQSTDPIALPTGLVIANDVDVQRCNLLIHQTKRMSTANLIVTNHEAQHFPSCHLKKNKANAPEMGIVTDPVINELLFDRVLCDVPCSGDGTLRKAPDIWKKWNGGMGNGLHGLQVQIAMRGLSLLKVGGRMVYSTCSMNPVENEAVVSELLRRCEGSVKLVDVSGELPHLVRRPGLKKWKVRDRGILLSSYKEVPKTRRGAVNASMFPSGKKYVETSDDNNDTTSAEMNDNGINSSSDNVIQFKQHSMVSIDLQEEEVSNFPLERCMRIVPHDQNTGAFFIAVLHKICPLPAFQKKPGSLHKLNSENIDPPVKLIDVKEHMKEVEANPTDVTNDQLPEAASDSTTLYNETEETAIDAYSNKMSEENDTEEIQAPGDLATGPEVARGKGKLQIQGRWKGVDPVVFFKDEIVVDKIKAFYGIREAFPFSGHLVTRNSDTNSVKRIYYIASSVKDILELNFLAGQQLKITSVGLKMFERQTSKEFNSPCAFRISSEGLPLILPHITKQILSASPIDFKHLLKYKTIKFSDFVDKKFGEKASNLLLGCFLVVLRNDCETSYDPSQHETSTVAIGCWRGRTNVSVMVAACDCEELLERLSLRTENGADPSLQENKLSSTEANVVAKSDTEFKEDNETKVLEIAD